MPEPVSLTASITYWPAGTRDVAPGVGLVELHVRGLDGEPAALRHRVARVDDQVDDHLLELAGVRLHAVQARRRHHRQLDVLADQPAQHRLHGGHHRVQVEHLGLQHLLAAEGQELPGERGGAVRGRAHERGVAVDRVLRPQPRQDHLGAPRDDGEQVVEVVRDAAREPADRLHLLGLAELLLELAPLRDVLEQAERADRGAARVAQHRDRRADLDAPAVPAQEAALVVAQEAVLIEPPLHAPGLLEAPRIHVDHRGADHLVRPAPEHRLGAPAEVGDAAVPVGGDDRVRRVLGDGLEEIARVADLAVQRRVLERHRALPHERGQQGQLVLGVGSPLHVAQAQHADDAIARLQRHREHRPEPGGADAAPPPTRAG